MYRTGVPSIIGKKMFCSDCGDYKPISSVLVIDRCQAVVSITCECGHDGLVMLTEPYSSTKALLEYPDV